MATETDDLPPTAQLADHLLPDGLDAFLRNGRASKASWDRLAKLLWLATEQRIDVSGVTVQAWADRLGIPEPEAVA